MKKKSTKDNLPVGRLRKILLIIAFKVLLLPCIFGTVSAMGYSQEQKMTVAFHDETVEQVLKFLKAQTNYEFVYQKTLLKEAKVKNLEMKDATLTEILNKVLRPNGFDYEIVDQVIVIRQFAKEQEKKGSKLVGKVVDKKKIPMPGVTVKLEKSNLGTATNVKGIFSLSLPLESGTLEISFVGYKTQKVDFTKATLDTLRITLEEDIQQLDETVVIAYGKTTKREAMGAITSIKGSDLLSVPTSNLSSLLQGRVAGMDVSNMSGSPGSGGTATILRGYNALSREQRDFSSPLWVIDGVPIMSQTSSVTGTNALSAIDPEMIESIEVLKDAAATSMYGSRAANGVILVTTKRGKAGERIIKANVSYSYSYIPEYPTVFAGKKSRNYKLKALRNYRNAYLDENNMPVYPTHYKDSYGKSLSAYDYFWSDGKETSAKNIPMLQDSLNAFYNNATNWFERFFQAGKVLTANLQAIYGTEKFNVSSGVGFFNEEGILKKSGFKRFNFMTNVGFRPTDRFSVDVSMVLSYARRKRNQGESVSSVMGSGDNLTNLPKDPFITSSFLPGGSAVEDEVLKGQSGYLEKNEDMGGRLNLTLRYDITDWLRLSTSNSVGYTLSKQNVFKSGTLNSDKRSRSTGKMDESRTLLTENLLVFNKEFAKRHKVEVLGGMSAQLDEEHVVYGSAILGTNEYVHYVNPGSGGIEDMGSYSRALQSYGSDYIQSIIVSFMGRFSYSFDKKYIIGASIRRDGSSKFGKAVPWGTFPSVSAAWVFSDESFMDFFGALDFGKLRGSWGETGMQFTSAYLAYGEMGMSGTFQSQGSVGPTARGLRNKNLSWETTGQYNMGVDLDFMNYRLGLVFDYYNRYTDDMFYMVNLPGDYSPYNVQPTNAGAISNKGIEFTLKYDIFRSDNFNWRVNFNIARNWNRFEKSFDNRDLDGYILEEPLNVIRRLKSLGVITDESQIPYKYNANGDKQFLGPTTYNGMTDVRQFYTVGDMLYLDANGDGMISNATDAVYIGSPLPKAQGGLMTELRWKDFDVSVNFTYSLGRTIINATKAQALMVDVNSITSPMLADCREYTFWEKPGDVTDFPRLSYDVGKNNFGIYSDQFVEDVNYLRMKSFVIGYTLPKKITNTLRLSKVRAYVSGENLFTWTNYTGMDPETVDIMTGFDDMRKYPLNRKFTVGLSVNF